MKVAIDARMYQESGIGRYIRNLIKELGELGGDNEYFILLRKKDFNTLMFKKNFNKILADFSWYGLKEQIKLPILLRSLKVDLVHFPHFNVPLFYSERFVVTVHDLIHQHFQMRRSTTHDPLVYKLKQAGYKKVFKNAISKSSKIMTPSSYVKQLLINECGMEEKKIVVTPEAVDDKIIRLSQGSRVKGQGFLEKFNIKQQYIFFVGNAHPHKNVEGLIRAFTELRKNHLDLQLVLVGNDHYFWQRLQHENQQPGIIYSGYITDEELVALYKNAKAFVMPSFEEGFGIPLLEAMASGCPVVSSNAGSLPEVGGDAALYFDPKDKAEMVDKINQALVSEKLREELRNKGKERVKQFSWEKLARQTLEVYQKCG